MNTTGAPVTSFAQIQLFVSLAAAAGALVPVEWTSNPEADAVLPKKKKLYFTIDSERLSQIPENEKESNESNGSDGNTVARPLSLPQKQSRDSVF